MRRSPQPGQSVRLSPARSGDGFQRMAKPRHPSPAPSINPVIPTRPRGLFHRSERLSGGKPTEYPILYSLQGTVRDLLLESRPGAQRPSPGFPKTCAGPKCSEFSSTSVLEPPVARPRPPAGSAEATQPPRPGRRVSSAARATRIPSPRPPRPRPAPTTSTEAFPHRHPRSACASIPPIPPPKGKPRRAEALPTGHRLPTAATGACRPPAPGVLLSETPPEGGRKEDHPSDD